MNYERLFGFAYGAVFGISLVRFIADGELGTFVLMVIAVGACTYFGVKNYGQANPDQAKR